MTVVLKATKSLISEQDILFGRGNEQQIRSGKPYIASAVRMLKIVGSFQELSLVDPSKFDFAFLRAEWPVLEEGEEPYEFKEGENDFYTFDYASTEDENLPYIVKPSEALVGRWKRVIAGEASVRALITDKLNKALANLNSYIEDKVEEIVEIQLPFAVEDAFGEIRKKGGEFDPSLSYVTNDYVRAFVFSRGLITERLYMVTRVTDFGPIDFSPLSGDVYSNINGTIVYMDNENLVEAPGYTRVFTLQTFNKEFEVEAHKNYSLFKPGQDVDYAKGRMKVKFWKDGTVTASFDVVFGGSSHRDFTLENVQYSRLARSKMIQTDFGHIYYPGFAIYANDIYFGLSIEKTDLVDKVWVDFTDLTKEPTPDPEPFASDRAYAARAGGGSYIPDLGDLKFNIRQYVDSDASCADFYFFMRGALPYSGPLSLVRDVYHQYYDSGITMPTMDITKRHIRIVGSGTPAVASLTDPSLPNIRLDNKKFSLNESLINSVSPYKRNTMQGSTYSMVRDVDVGSIVPTVNIQYNAHTESSEIYQDGVDDVNTLTFWVNAVLICY